MFIIFNNFAKNFQSFLKIYWYLYCLFFDFWLLSFSSLDFVRSSLYKKNKFSYYNNFNFFLKRKIFFNFNNVNFIGVDIIWSFIKSFNFFLKFSKIDIFRSYFRILNTNQGFYFNFKKLKNKKILNDYLKFSFLSGVKYIWIGLKFWILPLLIIFLIIYSSLVLRLLPFNKIMFAWIGVIMLCYWLISGFVFFFKKYQFGKYTTVVQRFWRRSYILFWLIEGGTFGVFVFLTINSSQESFYMFDQISIFKTHLYSWRFFLIKIFPIILLILITYFLLVSLKWNIYSKHSIWLLILTFFITYVVWLEFYQFFHVLNFYGNLNWVYDIEDHVWSLELEPRRTRIVNHYIMLMFILRFWHIVFIYGFWIFFVLRCWETNRIRYPLLSANFQNFIILYIFAWVFMYPWFKFFFHKIIDTPYYWFYVNNRRLFFRVFFTDFKLLYYAMIDLFKYNFIKYLDKFNYSSFFYWNFNNYENNFESYRKHIIKDRIVKSLIF